MATDTKGGCFYFTSKTGQTMNLSQRITLYLLILIAGASWIFISADPTTAAMAGTSAPQAGFSAPAINLKTPQGEEFTLTELRGKAVLVNLWATWCPPCRAEMPAIQRMYQEYKDRGFIVLGVNMTYQDDPFAVIPFVEEYDLTFPILLDETGETGAAYQVRSLPSSYFINREGIITEVVIGGPMSEALLRTRIEEALK